MDESVKSLLGLLERAREDSAILDSPELNEGLDRLRGLGPVRVKCPKCRATVSWWALHPAEPSVVFNSLGPRRRHLRKDQIPPDQLGPQPPKPFDDWSLGPMDGRHSAKNVDPTGGSNRWRFTCRRCGAQSTYTRATMLRMFVQWVATGQHGPIIAQ